MSKEGWLAFHDNMKETKKAKKKVCFFNKENTNQSEADIQIQQ
jgi:hypothetical protein